MATLSQSFRGRLVRPGDPSYEEDRRVWNGSVDRSPALIAHCTGVADVIDAIRFAASASAGAGPRTTRPPSS
ncbi:hypothetical protein AB0B78_40190, partial [Streptomyces sp. NPDC040724]